MHSLGQTPLTLFEFEKIIFHHHKVELSASAKQKMFNSLHWLTAELQKDKLIYGINTGFGSLKNKKISAKDQDKLQLNIIRSHCAGVGSSLSEEETRALMLLRAQVLAQGHSAVRPLLVETLLECLNKKIFPVIPEQGSVGASGDLAPLAHLALVLIGEGEVIHHSQKVPCGPLFEKIHIKPLSLTGREGLGLINGTQLMGALSALNILKAARLFRLFDVAAAMSIEAIQGSQKPFDADIHLLRPHPGQRQVAKNINTLLSGSPIQKHHETCTKVQDAYSFRCIPQVHGSSREALAFAQKIIETELNSVTDNPIFFPEKNKYISGGNFHGQYLSQAMDFLAIATATLINISERRIEKILDSTFSGLPPFLAKNPGLESGFMAVHYTAAALASENKVLSHPASTDTISTSEGQEDHVSMGPHAARKTREILQNAEYVVSIELLVATQGLEYLKPLKTSAPLEKVKALIRKYVAPLNGDRLFAKDIETIKNRLPDVDEITRGILE